MYLDVLDELPPDLRYRLIAIIIAQSDRQSDRAALQWEMKRHFESRTRQGERTDLRPQSTCTPEDVQVARRRQSTIEKVGCFFHECGATVRSRLYVYEKATEDPVRYGQFLILMDTENSPVKAAEALKLFERTERFDRERIPEPEWSHIERGDLWNLGKHHLACGDATCPEDVGSLLGGVVPLLMVTDPPYGVNYDPAWRREVGNGNPNKMGLVPNDDRVDWSDAWKLFLGDVAYVYYADRHAEIVQAGLRNNGLIVRNQIVCVKSRYILSRGHYSSQKETCFYTVRSGKSAPWNTKRSQPDVWEVENREDRGHGHSTQKPIECMLKPMEHNSAEGDAVYDPFVGSGTTIIAAEECGRRCYAMDIAPDYCAKAIERWQNWTDQQATLASTGQSYAEVMQERCREAGDAALVAQADGTS